MEGAFPPTLRIIRIDVIRMQDSVCEKKIHCVHSCVQVTFPKFVLSIGLVSALLCDIDYLPGCYIYLCFGLSVCIVYLLLKLHEN